MDDGISETLHVASMGVDVTFKLLASTAHETLELIKFLCSKAVLNKNEKESLKTLMTNNLSTSVQINMVDVKDFERLLKDHKVAFTMAKLITRNNKNPEVMNFAFDANKLDIVNVCLRAINYGEIEGIVSKGGEEKNAGASNRTSTARSTGSGGVRSEEDKSQSFDSYVFSSSYDPREEAIAIPVIDRVAVMPPSEKSENIADEKVIPVVEPAPAKTDAYSFLTDGYEQEDVKVEKIDRIQDKNVFKEAKNEFDAKIKAVPEHMDPPDLSLTDAILARAREKQAALVKEKQAAAMMKGLETGVAAAKEAMK